MVSAGFDVRVSVTCTKCKRERAPHEEPVRFLGEPTSASGYADTTEPCACGHRRVKLEIDVG